MGLIELILLIAFCYLLFGSPRSKKSGGTNRYGGGYTYNHTPPPVDTKMPTQKFEGGYNGELNKEFENK